MSTNKQKYFVVSHVVKANNKTEAAEAIAPRRRTNAGQMVFTPEPSVERISAVEARQWA